MAVERQELERMSEQCEGAATADEAVVGPGQPFAVGSLGGEPAAGSTD